MAELQPEEHVVGSDVADVEVQGPSYRKKTALPWDSLSTTRLLEGLYTLRLHLATGGPVRAAEIPVCAVRKHVQLDGHSLSHPTRAPFVQRFDDVLQRHELTIEVNVSKYERRIACGAPVRVGRVTKTRSGWSTLSFDSPYASQGGGKAAVYIPTTTNTSLAVALGLHPWNGDPWTYAAYSELVRAADDHGVVLLQPSGLGNSLYTQSAEDEVMRSLAALRSPSIDETRMSIWGASMGGAGATTIGFHRPDRFAIVLSYFGDSKYDLTTYVRSLLGNEAGAKRINALDVVDNARHLPVSLIHGTDDRVSPIVQSEMLYDALRKRGFAVTFKKMEGRGHDGLLVAEHIAAFVEQTAKVRAVRFPSHVTYRTFRNEDAHAYGVHFERAEERVGAGAEAFIDIESTNGRIVIHDARGIRAIVLEPGTFGVADGSNVPVDAPNSVTVRWTK